VDTNYQHDSAGEKVNTPQNKGEEKKLDENRRREKNPVFMVQIEMPQREEKGREKECDNPLTQKNLYGSPPKSFLIKGAPSENHQSAKRRPVHGEGLAYFLEIFPYP
jgi:hypothetical protein